MSSRSSFYILLMLSVCGLSLQAFQQPKVLDNLALKTTAESPDTCADGDHSDCNQTCPTRLVLPAISSSPLMALQQNTDCSNTSFSDSLPDRVDISKGQLLAPAGTGVSCTKFSEALPTQFSISLWVKFTCESW